MMIIEIQWFSWPNHRHSKNWGKIWLFLYNSTTDE